MAEYAQPSPGHSQSLPGDVLHIDDPYPESLAELFNEVTPDASSVSLRVVQYAGERVMCAVTFTPQQTLEHPDMLYSATGRVVVPNGVNPATKTMGILEIPTDPELPIVITLDK